MIIRRPRVIYWNNIPSPYVVERFNAVADRGNLNLLALFTEEREPDRSWTVSPSAWRFEARYAGRLGPSLAELSDHEVLISLYENAHYIQGVLRAKAAGLKVALRVLPTYEAWQSRRAHTELAKHMLFRAVDAAKVPGPDGAAYAAKYGLDADRVFHVTQSPTVLPRVPRTVGPEGLVQLLFVGRLWRGKGLEHLAEAFDTVRERLLPEGIQVQLHLVGDGDEGTRLRDRWAQLSPSSVRFHGFLEGRDLAHAYAQADALIFPTLGDPHGLVVDEAHAQGTPVIASSAAGDIVRRLALSGGGIVYPAGDAQALAVVLERYCRDKNELRRMGRLGLEYSRMLSHAAYASDLEHMVERVLLMRARGLPSMRAGGGRRKC